MSNHLPILSCKLHLTASVKENVNDSAHSLVGLVKLTLFCLEQDLAILDQIVYRGQLQPRENRMIGLDLVDKLLSLRYLALKHKLLVKLGEVG